MSIKRLRYEKLNDTQLQTKNYVKLNDGREVLVFLDVLKKIFRIIDVVKNEVIEEGSVTATKSASHKLKIKVKDVFERLGVDLTKEVRTFNEEETWKE